MNLTAILLIVASLHVTAETFSQKVSITAKNIPIVNVFKSIEKQTGYQFFYKKALLKNSKPVNLDIKDEDLSKALALFLPGQNLSFSIEDKFIVIVAKTTAGKTGNLKPSLTPALEILPPVSGIVKGPDGQPVAGANIIVKGTNKGVTSAADGSFSIVAKKGDVLIISSVGYNERELVVGTSVSLEPITLTLSDSKLDEVAVVAFATQKKETVTGAIASIKTKEIKQSPAANLAVALAGRLPGLTTLQTSGEPGRDITALYIRGRATINSTAPIVLIDGIERDLTYIDPNEVESVTILKDASSTALFGVRGANGVILVTTKRGTSEEPDMNFSFEAAAQDFPNFFKMVNSYQYASLRNLALKNDGLQPQFSDKTLEMYKTGADPVNYPNTNWRDVLLKDVALQQRYNLNISGATSNGAMKYFVNATYLNQGGQFKIEDNLPYDPSFKLDRYSFRSNIDLKLNKTLDAFLNVAGYLEKQNMPMSILNRIGDIPTQLAGMSPAVYIVSFMARVPANVPKLTPAGDVTTAANIDWPAYGLLNRSGYIRQTRSNVLATFGLKQDLASITKGLSTRVIMSFDTKSVNNLYGGKEFVRYMQVINPNTEDISFS